MAQQIQTNVQTSSNNATVVGDGNYVDQNADQYNFQNQAGGYGYYDYYGGADPQTQISVQNGTNNATVVGGYNTVIQDLNQTNVQNQVTTPQVVEDPNAGINAQLGRLTPPIPRPRF
jgi:hypothetical protein